jgi:hypothetical protein
MTNDQLSMTNGGGGKRAVEHTLNTAFALGHLPLGFGHSRIIRERVRE